MWYSRRNMTVLLFTGVILASVGLWLYIEDITAAGVLLIIVGVSIVMFAFAVLKLYMSVRFGRI
ncbi:MAG: hypothetical protein FWH44_03975 [Methanomassiliicoccaceae archaeon]|nr:hypothetical protein [Methanomassiliicoccaceae archaeon]